jgi:hypothetical protein
MRAIDQRQFAVSFSGSRPANTSRDGSIPRASRSVEEAFRAKMAGFEDEFDPEIVHMHRQHPKLEAVNAAEKSCRVGNDRGRRRAKPVGFKQGGLQIQ